MRKPLVLAVVLGLAACSRNPEPEGEPAGGVAATGSDTTMMADSAKRDEMGMPGDSAQAPGDSALVNQEGRAKPGEQTMESDTVMGDSALTGQADDTRSPGDSSMEGSMNDSAAVEDAIPTDSSQGQRR